MERITEAARKKGMMTGYLIRLLEISSTQFYRKDRGTAKWTEAEKRKLQEALNLTDGEIDILIPEVLKDRRTLTGGSVKAD